MGCWNGFRERDGTMAKPSFQVGDKTIVSQSYTGWAAGEPVEVVGVEFREMRGAYRGSTTAIHESIRIRHDQTPSRFEFEVSPEDLLPCKVKEQATPRRCSCVREITGSWADIGTDRTCPFRTGEGYSAAKACEKCHGTGVVE